MALKDLLALVDDKLKDLFHTVAYDATKDRAKLAKRIEATKTKFLATEPPRGRKDFSVANNVVAYSPTVNGNPLVLEGRDVNYVPAERFSAFLDLMKTEVEEGRLDKEIEAAATSAPTSVKLGRNMARTGVAEKGERIGGGAGWSESRKEKFAATIQARKAAKEAAGG